MPLYLVYRPATGAVTGRRYNSAEDAPLGLPPGAELLEIEEDGPLASMDLAALYVDGAGAHARLAPPITLSATSIAADGVAEAVIAGIPAGSVLTITGATAVDPAPIDDGEVFLTSTAVGALEVRLDCPPPYLRWEATVHAT